MDPYAEIASFYDCEHESFHDDVEFYLNLLSEGPILEIGAGTGRVTEPLVRAGLAVWAVDPSDAMLHRARERLRDMEGAHFVCESAEALDLGQRFEVALLPLNTLWHLTTADAQLAALAAVRRHLFPGALLVIDLSSPLAMVDRGAAGEVRQVYRGACGGATVTRTVATWDDRAEQVLTLSLTYHVAGPDSLREITSEMELRYVYRAELELMLRLTGFAVRQVYGSYELDAYTEESERLIVVAEARGTPTRPE